MAMNPLKITDTILRDAHQSQAATRMRIEDMLPEYLVHWGLSLNAGIRKVISYAQERPAKLLGYFQNALKLSDADMKKYFGAAIEEMRESPIWESIEEVAEGILGEGEY